MDSLAFLLEPVNLPLSQLYLDPNNPRFVGSDWTYVPDDLALNQEAQSEATTRLISHHDIRKLQAVIEANGFLPIDRVVVRKVRENFYIVVEGNRRVCAAKQINGFSEDGRALTADIMSTLTNIPCLEYTGSADTTEIAWVFQGLRHISGISDWPAFNKAKLIVDQVEKSNSTYTEVGKRFGLSAFGTAQWVRGFYAFRQAKSDTEYTWFLDEKIYPYFQEIFGRSSIALKDWLNWDDTKKKFLDEANLNEFVGWFFPGLNTEDQDIPLDREPAEMDRIDAWNRRRISTRDDLRRLSYLLIKSPKEWLGFRSGGNLELAYNRAMLTELEDNQENTRDAGDKLFNYLDETTKLLISTPFSVISNAEKREQLFTRLIKLESIGQDIRKHISN